MGYHIPHPLEQERFISVAWQSGGESQCSRVISLVVPAHVFITPWHGAGSPVPAV